VSFGTQATEAEDGSSKKKREASADPTFFEGPAETGAFGLTDRERETVEVRLDGDPDRIPSGI
jgi:hypothetical protein